MRVHSAASMEEIYKGHKIVVTMLPIPSSTIGRHGSAGKSWTIHVDGQNIVDRISYIGMKDVCLVMGAVKRYVDRTFS